MSRKKVTKKVIKRVMKKVMKKAVRKMKTKKTPSIGRVIHFYDRISVAIIELNETLRIGDAVVFKHGSVEVAQVIGSMQINHVAVPSAKKKQVVGVKTTASVPKGAQVMPMK